MLVFPNCKINLGLTVTGRRNDGYHNIETVFYPVPLNDALEIIHSTVTGAAPVTGLTISGLPVSGEEHNNLCFSAWQLLKKNHPHLPAISIHLHKVIPMGAGLGGGSADAAFTLTALNEKYTLGLSSDELLSYALQLGSDCPFFIINKPCIAGGRGEILQPVNISLSGYQLLLIHPGVHIDTQWAFSQLNISTNHTVDVAAPGNSLQSAVLQPVSDWKKTLINDFEKPVFEKYPAIGAIKEDLYNRGALFASMSGSGSAVYGIFANGHQPELNFPKNYFFRHLFL